MDAMDTFASAHHLGTGDAPPLDPDSIWTAIPVFPSLIVFLSSAVGLGLCIFFVISLADLTEDLINPYVFEKRINPMLKIELAAHVAIILAYAIALNPYALAIAVPTLAIRIFWHISRTLEADATTCFHGRTQSILRTRWGIMSAWHGLTMVFAFVQLILHAVIALARTAPVTLHKLSQHPASHPGLIANPFAAAAMHAI